MNYKRSIFVLFFSLLSLPLLALGKSYDVEVDGIFYVLNKDANEASVVMGSDEIVGTGNYETWKRVASYRGDVVIPESFVYNNIEYTVTSIKTLRNWTGSMMGDWEYYHAFENCVELTSITIPKSIKRIDSNSFYGCTSLEAVYISDLSAWCRIDFDEWYPYGSSSNPLRFAHDLYINGSKVTELVIPEDINVINEYTFIGGSFTSLILHKNIEEIKWIAFDECNNLRDIYFYGTRLKTTSYDMWQLGDEELTWHIREKYQSQISCFCAKHIEYIEGIDPQLIYVVEGEFYKKEFPDPGETIIPEPDPSMEGCTFSGWIGLPDIMPDNDVIVNGFFLPNTYRLTYIVNGVKYIVVEIKYNEIIIPEPYPIKKGMTFSGWSEIPEKMPAKDVTIIGTFSWSKVTKDRIIYQVTDTISNCAAVIDNEDASGGVIIASDIEFDYNYKVMSIVNNALNGCKGITSMEIPATITNIGERAFANIDKLTDVTIYAENVPETDRTAFENSYVDYATLHVPYGSVDKYKAVGPWKDFKEIVAIEGTQRTFVLTYMVDSVVYKTYEVKEGEAITPEPEPTKKGYTFLGWSEIPAVMPSENLTITGTFTINKYKLTYIVDDKEYKEYEVEYNAAITPEPAPEKEGYTFSGWSEIPKKMPAKDVTVTGTFIINKYKLVYKVDNSVYNESEVVYGAAITPLEAPTKEGYTFSGWSEIPETMPAHDVTVTGTFTINKYKLTYMVDGEVYKTYDVEYGATITPEAEPTKEGYSFSGWSEIPETMPAKDVTVAGEFTVNKYKLTYEVDGSEYKSYDVEFGATITPEEEPTKEGYTFSGWSTIPETMPAHDVTITGSFTKGAYKLIYKIDGEVYKTYTYDFGAEITPEAAPEKEGYTFSGWSDIPTTMPANDVKVTGSFAVNKYNLIYKVDGEVYKEYEMEYGAEITPEEEPTKEGWEFSGWSWIPKKMPAEDVIITGTFTQIEYDVDGSKYAIDDDEVTIVDGGDVEGEVVIDATITINGKTYKVTVIGEGAYQGNDKITSVDIPEGIETILANAFLNCTGINTLKIGKTIKHIGSKAFGNIWSSAVGRRASDNPLTIECHAESVPEADADCFDGTPIANAVLLVDDSLVESYKAVAPWCYFGEIKGFNEASGIDAIFAGQQKAAIYSIDGQRLDMPRKGMNIIKTRQGVKKVMVK